LFGVSWVPSPGEFAEDGESAPTPAGMPGEGVYEVKYRNKRTNVVRLLPNGAQERRLRRLADACARLWNELNYERRQQFFNHQHVDFKGTWSKYYEKYKNVLGVNAQAVLQKNNEAWSSFFSLLRLKKEGKLPPYMNHISPPGYWKDKGTRMRKLLLVVRQDRLEMHYDDARNAWYACIPVEVGVEEARAGRKSKHIVRGERKSIQVELPKGSKVASIDLGINNLASVVVSDGTWLLYKGVRAKEDYFYLQRLISRIQSLRDTLKDKLLADAVDELNREVRRLSGKLRRRLLHLYRNFASHLLKQLHELGVSTIYLGYPFNIAQERGNKFTVNMWTYRKLMEAIELKAQEYGIRVFEVVEYNTSRVCAYHNVEVKRQPRGVVSCPKGHKLHSDLNGALNIMRRAIGKIPPVIKKPLSFIVDHNKVAPVKGEVTPKTPEHPAL